jgi:hypothetical protein
MKTRKMVLLGTIAVLACAFVIELMTSPSGAVKTVALAEKPDSIQIEKGGSKLVLAKEGDKWTVGEKKYPADIDKVDSIVNAVSTLKVFETLSGGDDATRFGLGEKDGLTVTAWTGGKELRRIEVGKATSTARQSYVRLGGDTDILMVSGNLTQEFGVGLSELRDKRVFSFAVKDATAVEVRGKESYSLSKTGESAAWKVDGLTRGKEIAVENAKVDGWLSSLASLRASDFAPEGTAPTGEPFATVKITLGSRTASLAVYSVPKIGENKDKAGYLCSSSETPYLFYIPEYDVTRSLKPLAELSSK